MAVQTLPRLREVLGEEGVDELVRWLDDRIAERAVPRDEYREVLSRLDILEHDVSDIKVNLRDLRREMNERFDWMNERFNRMNERFGRMNEHFDQMYDRMLVQTRWLIGLLTLIGAVVSALLAIGQFVK